MATRTSTADSMNCSIFLQFSPLLHGIYFTLGITSDINGAEEMAHQIKAFVTHVWWKENQLHKLVLCLHMCTVAYTRLYCRCTYVITTNKARFKNINKGKKNKTENVRNSNFQEATVWRQGKHVHFSVLPAFRQPPCPRSLGHISLGILHQFCLNACSLGSHRSEALYFVGLVVFYKPVFYSFVS